MSAPQRPAKQVSAKGPRTNGGTIHKRAGKLQGGSIGSAGGVSQAPGVKPVKPLVKPS